MSFKHREECAFDVGLSMFFPTHPPTHSTANVLQHSTANVLQGETQLAPVFNVGF
jgi:hypothetical protein